MIRTETEDVTRDPYANRRRLRRMPIYISLAPPVRAMVLAQSPPMDPPLRHWLVMLRYARRLHAWGLLTIEDLQRAERLYPEWWYQWKVALAGRELDGTWLSRRDYDYSIPGYRRMRGMQGYGWFTRSMERGSAKGGSAEPVEPLEAS